MANYMKRGNKWQARITWRDSNGKLRQKSKGGFETKQLARQYAAKLEARRLAGEKVQSNLTLLSYYQDWFKTYKQHQISKVTARHYQWTENEIKKYFGNIELRKITRHSYQQFINDFGSKHAPETVKKLNSICRACIKSAVTDGYLEKDITANTSLVYDESRKLKVNYLSVQELHTLIQALNNGLQARYPSRYMILSAIYTGARLGEIMALTWKDINFNFKTITINKAWDYHNCGGFKPTKNESSVRTIRVNQELLDTLQELRINQQELVFANPKGDIPSSNAVNKVLRKIMKDNDIYKQGFHFHSLRHSHVAFLLSQGINLYAISKRLGHSDITTTANRYSYLIDEYKAKTDDRIESYLDALNSTSDVQMMYSSN